VVSQQDKSFTQLSTLGGTSADFSMVGHPSDGLFEPQLTPIMDDYILARRNNKATAISLQPDDLNTIKNCISFDGRQTFTDAVADGEKPIHIPTPEELSSVNSKRNQFQIEP
jgi:hypothetical protein